MISSNQFLTAQDNLNCSFLGGWYEGPTQTVDINNNYIFINNGRYLEILDNTDPNNPILISTFLSRGFIYDIKVVDTLVYLGCTDNGLSIINISDLSNPKEIGFLESLGYYPRIEIQDNKLYLSNHSNYGVQAIDISNPTNPILLNKYKVNFAKKIKVKENFLFVAGGWKGFKIFDISNPEAPVEISHLELNKTSYDFTIKNNRIT
jgi:hypothetical protein